MRIHQIKGRLVNSYLIEQATALVEGLRPRAWAMYASLGRSAQARVRPAWQPDRDLRTRESRPATELCLKHGSPLPDFAGWQVLHTPGHSWDSVCYYHAPSGSLISGDTLLGSSSRGTLVPPAVYANPRQMARTLQLLKSLRPSAVYPGHGSHFHGSGLLDHL